jgi:hypothetical protein
MDKKKEYKVIHFILHKWYLNNLKTLLNLGCHIIYKNKEYDNCT